VSERVEWSGVESSETLSFRSRKRMQFRFGKIHQINVLKINLSGLFRVDIYQLLILFSCLRWDSSWLPPFRGSRRLSSFTRHNRQRRRLPNEKFLMGFPGGEGKTLAEKDKVWWN
jgi:hypothetical protein